MEPVHVEHFRVGNNNSSPHPTENSAASDSCSEVLSPLTASPPSDSSLPLNLRPDSSLAVAPPIHPDPSPPTTPDRRESDADPTRPPTASPQSHTEKNWLPRFEPPQLNPLFQGLERPSFSRIAILTALSLITYPAFYILTLVAQDKSLFVVRSIVSVWCWGIGFALGYVLLKIGAQHLEAATWATVIHMSYEGEGMKLCDLARSSSGTTSFMPAPHLFRSRFGNQETSWRSRKSYDKRPWSLFMGFFILLVILGPMLSFLFGRIIVIKTFVTNRRNVYSEVLIAGDLSQEDVGRAIDHYSGASEDFPSLAWSLLPYGRSTSETVELVYGNDTVYFAQPLLSQFVGGAGGGTFNLSQPASTGRKGSPDNIPVSAGRNTPRNNTGVVLRYSQWGIRIHCEKLPEPEVNLVPFSNQSWTYAFVPQNFLRGLFGVYGMDLPTAGFTGQDFGLRVNDTMPSNIDPSTISYVVASPNNGEGLSLHSVTFYDPYPDGDQGWTTVETVLLRFYSSHTPSGRFPVYSDKAGIGTRIGYDAAVCVQKYEPWIIETYNASIVSPSTFGIFGKGNGSTSLSSGGKILGDPIANTRYLNTTGKQPAFTVAHGNGIKQIMKDNSRDSNYIPSPTAVSFTDGAGPFGYTELSPDQLSIIRARVGAANTLPYLAGSAPVVAKSYGDETLAYTTYKLWQLIGLPGLALILGIIGELFVPTLPHDTPRRNFGVYSWLALFQSQELQLEADEDLHKLMSLDEIEERFSDKRVKFVREEGGI